MNVKAPDEMVTGPALKPSPPSSISNEPDIEIAPLELVAATFKSASEEKSSVAAPELSPVPNEPYDKLIEPDIDMSPADAKPAVNTAVEVRRTFHYFSSN